MLVDLLEAFNNQRLVGGATAENLRRILSQSGGMEPDAQSPRPQVRDVRRRLGAARIEQLVNDYESGESSKALSSKYGIGKTTIVRILRGQNITIRNQSMDPKLVEQALELHATGMGYKSIARQLGVPKESMRQAMLRRATT